MIFNRLANPVNRVLMSCLMFTKANLSDLEIVGNITVGAVSAFSSFWSSRLVVPYWQFC